MSDSLERRVAAVRHLPPLATAGAGDLRELDDAIGSADSFEDLPGKWQAAILEAEAEGHEPVHDA